MKHGHRFLIGGLVVVLAVALVLVVVGGQGAMAADSIIYVDAEATGANNGTSWDDAYAELQPALEDAADGDEVWVAAGIYTPTVKHGGTSDRYRSFQMKNGVAIYGGFDPSVGDLAFEDRDWEANRTILSGDLNGDDEPGFENDDDNSYHVFYHPEGTNLDSTAILDGFTITAGNANGDSSLANTGGGMCNEFGSSPMLTNCTFEGNSARMGGAVHNWNSQPTLVNCTLSGNSASYAGGGIWNEGSSPVLTNCTFEGNSAESIGGAMANAFYASPRLINCTFVGNEAADGGGMHNYYNCLPVLTNCILWGNTPDQIANSESAPVVTYSDLQGGCNIISGNVCGTGNIDTDPLFVDAENGDYHLLPDSPCIDVGDNDALELPGHDFEGDDRILDGDGDGDAIVDMGVDEALWCPVYLPLVFKG